MILTPYVYSFCCDTQCSDMGQLLSDIVDVCSIQKEHTVATREKCVCVSVKQCSHTECSGQCAYIAL